jgi:hypothetical protein
MQSAPSYFDTVVVLATLVPKYSKTCKQNSASVKRAQGMQMLFTRSPFSIDRTFVMKVCLALANLS